MKFFLLNNLDDQINNFLPRNGRFVELSCRTPFSIVRLCQDIIGNHLTVMKFVEEIIIFIDIHYKKKYAAYRDIWSVLNKKSCIIQLVWSTIGHRLYYNSILITHLNDSLVILKLKNVSKVLIDKS